MLIFVQSFFKKRLVYVHVVVNICTWECHSNEDKVIISNSFQKSIFRSQVRLPHGCIQLYPQTILLYFQTGWKFNCAKAAHVRFCLNDYPAQSLRGCSMMLNSVANFLTASLFSKAFYSHQKTKRVSWLSSLFGVFEESVWLLN